MTQHLPKAIRRTSQTGRTNPARPIALLGAALAVSFISLSPANAGDKPNIVFLYADDLGWSDLACYGNPWFETPHLDQLAAEGLRFTEAYAPAPICSASRAAVLTGQTPARLQFEFVVKHQPGRQDFDAPMRTPPYPENLDPDWITLPRHLAKAGIHSAFFGKWHLNQHHQRYLGWSPAHGPLNHGFDTAVEDFGAHPYAYWRDEEKRTFLEDLSEGQFIPDTMNQRAIDFLRDRAQMPGDPFFLYVSHFHVHDPIHTRARWLYQRALARVPEHHPRREILAHYGAMVFTLDQLVGDVVAAVDEAGLAEDTLILFTSDNGGHPQYAGNAPLRGSKWNLYEGGIRVPMIARWPGTIPAGTETDTPVTGCDLLPTFADLAGLPVPEGIDGNSVALLLQSPDATPYHRPLFWHFPYYHPEGQKFTEAPEIIGIDDGLTSKTRPHSAVRRGPWKLLHFHEDDRQELYHLKEDPAELNDRARADPETAQELRALLDDYLQEVEARFPEAP